VRRYAHNRVDANHTACVALLRAAGFSVTSTAGLGGGFPDLAIGRHGRTVLIELKDGTMPLSRRALSEAEERWHSSWQGCAAIAESAEEALRIAEERTRA
jgi:hypothetical protein